MCKIRHHLIWKIGFGLGISSTCITHLLLAVNDTVAEVCTPLSVV